MKDFYMKRLRRNLAKLLAITLAACSAQASYAQTVGLASEDPFLSAASHAHYDLAPEAASQPCYDTHALRATCRPCGPQLYFQAEAMFLSRQYDVAGTGFGLFNAPTSSTLGRTTSPAAAAGWINSVDWNPQDLGEAAFFSDDFERADQLTGSPRLTLGVVGASGFGIQGRYWRMENAATAFGASVDAFSWAGDTNGLPPTETTFNDDWYTGSLSAVAGFEDFRTQTFDLEGTKDFRYRGWSGVGTLGVRYADIRNRRVNAIDGVLRTGGVGDVGTGTQEEHYPTYHTAAYDFLSLQQVDFSGVGPTFSLTALRPFTYNPEFALFTSARGAVLFGDSTSNADVQASMHSFYASQFDRDSELIRTSDELFIAELQLGLQWSRNVRFMNGRVFARAAFEYQFWRNDAEQAVAVVNVGDYGAERVVESRSPSDGGIGTTEGAAFAIGLRNRFDLIGMSFGAGFAF